MKYECLYIRAFENGKTLQQGLKQYFDWYNRQRPHQGLDDQTPDEVYRGLPHWRQAA
ncbi:MAG: transposase [Gammaproteobacteria bacterium]|nr:transposase [Gammaproteobacteria bacterium]